MKSCLIASSVPPFFDGEVPVYRLRRESPTVKRALPRTSFLQLDPTKPSRLMPTTKIVPSQKSSRRRLNTGSVSNSRQEATPASAEVDPSTSSTPSVSLRGDAESAEVSSSLSGQTVMDTHGSVVPSQSSLVESRIHKRRDRSPSTLQTAYMCSPSVSIPDQ